MSAEADVQLEDFENIFRLDGRVAVVTGGSRGLGLHAASGYVEKNRSYILFQPCLPPSRPGAELRNSPQIPASSKPAAAKCTSRRAKPRRAMKRFERSMA